MPDQQTAPVVTGYPTVKRAGSPLTDSQMQALAETIVDLDSTRPGMFILRFLQSSGPGDDVSIPFAIGDEVEVLEAGTSKSLIKGEVTSLEGEFGNSGQRTTVRGYDKSHRLHRARQYKAYPNKTDSDIVSEIASAVGITKGDVATTSSVHKYLVQVNQTDWEFLKWRAEENGLTVDVADGNLNFRKPDSPSDGPTFSAQNSLLAFRPRISAPPVNSVIVNAWDESQKQAFTETTTLPASTAAELSSSPSSLATKFGSEKHTSAIRSAEAQGDVTAASKALADRFADSFIEAEAVTYGDPDLKPGVRVTVEHAGTTFNGKYRITSVKHVFNSDVRYNSRMRFTGIHDKSLLGLTSNGGGSGTRMPLIQGVVPALVTNAQDPENRCRVKVKFPWLGDDVETEWARTMQVGAGGDRGMVIVPEVNDEVLVAFEQGDFRRPYILGGVYNGTDKPLAGTPHSFGSDGKVKLRGFASRLGHTLVFDDADDKSGIHLTTADGNFELWLNQKDTKITIDAKSGKVEIHGAQDVTVKSDANINIEAQQALSLKGTTGVTIESSAGATVKATGQMEVSGMTTAVSGQTTLDLKGGATASLKAAVVSIN